LQYTKKNKIEGRRERGKEGREEAEQRGRRKVAEGR
jgi:hypothetical protein